MKPFGYHAHVYFDETIREAAVTFRERIKQDWGSRLRVHGLVDQPIGPHPLPMFEVDVPPAHFDEFRSWLGQHHGELSVLLHPQTGDEMADHRDHAQWVGKVLPLRFDILAALLQSYYH